MSYVARVFRLRPPGELTLPNNPLDAPVHLDQYAEGRHMPHDSLNNSAFAIAPLQAVLFFFLLSMACK
jgi:hypothetical protein